MDKPKWGCPSCGSARIIQHVMMGATRHGTFREQNGGWTFDGDEEVDRDSLDLSDEGSSSARTAARRSTNRRGCDRAAASASP